jgi:hypothetical protein
MEDYLQIEPPLSGDDREGAQRVFEEFLVLYQPALSSVQHYLERVIFEAPDYADAYKPWHKALQDLFQGVYLTAKRIPLPDPDAFLEALRMFSFQSAIQFLCDLCISCRLALQRDWAKHFHEHINMLLFSQAILAQKQQPLRAC